MPAQYGDPSQERLSDGRSFAQLMPGRKGLRGVVIQHATQGGVPQGYDPHAREHLIVHVDPDKGNTTLHMDKVTNAAVKAAREAAAAQIPGNDIEDIRERTAMVMETLAKMTTSGVKVVPTKRAKTAAAPTLPPMPRDEVDEATEELEAEVQEIFSGPVVTSPPIDKIDRAYSPMEAFGLKKSAPGIRPASTAVLKSPLTGPPQKLLYFEKEGIGTVPAFFHDVLVAVSRQDTESVEESGFIVLVYDIRFEQAAARWFPPANDPYDRPWALQINDDNRLYLVHTTGFQYLYDSREYCVLRVERALRAPPGDE